MPMSTMASEMGCGAADQWQDGMTRVRRERRLWGRTKRRSDERNDAGFSIVEIVVTIAIMSVVVLAVLVGVITTIDASSRTRGLAQLETVIQNAADRVNRATPGCGYQLFAEAAARTQGWPATSVTVVEKHYVPGATAALAGSWVPNACSGTTITPLLVQMVTVTITNPETGATKSIDVIKSEV
jgi:prepilin-type N-terminal cleavage/methylation domain-containing protein